MNRFVLLVLVVLVVLTVITVTAEVYCAMAERRKSEGRVTPVKEDQTIKDQGSSPANGIVDAVRQVA
jgi:hypothetical protein